MHSDLAAYRRTLRLSQEQFAAELGMRSKGHISNIEKGSPAGLRLALKIEAHSRGLVPADGLVSPEDAHLLAGHRALANRIVAGAA